MKVYLIIPAYNEPGRLEKVISKAKKYIPAKNIIVVDDGSQTPVKLPGIIVLRHMVNLGKGAALKTGADFAFAKGTDAVIFMDADGQHDPGELPKFIKFLSQGYDLVFGSRRMPLQTPFVRLMGNKIASIYINVVFGIYVSDILSGFRAITQKAYGAVKWNSPRYGVETEMVARLGKHKHRLKYIEFPVETIYIDKYKGLTIIDGIKILINSLWWKLS
jgi:glycosyltransferase involved in cell wall biosynthesis